MSDLEQPGLRLPSVRERIPLVAEQFGLQQRFGDCSAIEVHERSVRTRTGSMHDTRQKAFACRSQSHPGSGLAALGARPDGAAEARAPFCRRATIFGSSPIRSSGGSLRRFWYCGDVVNWWSIDRSIDGH